MKKRTAFIGAILSLIPISQPLLFKTGVFFSTTVLMLTIPEKVNAESAESQNTKGIKAYEDGDSYSAISFFNKAIKKDPNTAYFNNRGLAKMSIGDQKGALIDFQESVNVNPNYDEAFGNLCAVKFDLKDYYGAISDCNKAIKISPKERYFFNRGNAKNMLKDHKGAIEDVNRGLEIDPKSARGYLIRSMAKESLKDIKGACSDARKSKSFGNNNEVDNQWIKDNCKRRY